MIAPPSTQYVIDVSPKNCADNPANSMLDANKTTAIIRTVLHDGGSNRFSRPAVLSSCQKTGTDAVFPTLILKRALAMYIWLNNLLRVKGYKLEDIISSTKYFKRLETLWKNQERLDMTILR